MKVHEHRQCIGNNPECQVCTGYSCESYPHCIICGEDWQDQVGPPARAVQPCRRVGIHDAHCYYWNGSTMYCSGVEHAHDRHCCPEHGTHVMPHTGYILR